MRELTSRWTCHEQDRNADTGSDFGTLRDLGVPGCRRHGEVYKAFDTRLNRVVAIKRLTGPRSDRFQEEAHAIAALTHSHICQIYDESRGRVALRRTDRTRHLSRSLR